MKTYYVYMLKCADKTYYTGFTNDLDRRLSEHQEGYNPKSYTHNRRPVELVFFETFNDPNNGIAFEKKIKKWSQKKKEALINKKWERLKELAKCKNETSHELLDEARSERSRGARSDMLFDNEGTKRG